MVACGKPQELSTVTDREGALSIQADREQSIRESYRLIREYEDIIRLSDRPKEKLRAKREIEEQ